MVQGISNLKASNANPKVWICDVFGDVLVRKEAALNQLGFFKIPKRGKKFFLRWMLSMEGLLVKSTFNDPCWKKLPGGKNEETFF